MAGCDVEGPSAAGAGDRALSVDSKTNDGTSFPEQATTGHRRPSIPVHFVRGYVRSADSRSQRRSRRGVCSQPDALNDLPQLVALGPGQSSCAAALAAKVAGEAVGGPQTLTVYGSVCVFVVLPVYDAPTEPS